MPLKPVQKLIKMDQKQNRKEADKSHRRVSSNFPKKKDKFGRKRSQSFTGGNNKFCAPYKSRRPMLPTKFLLGGNICDPLNLNSLQDEEVNRTVNAVTPKSSPVPTPPQRRGHIEVIIPPNIHDPLNLIDCADDAEYQQQLTSPVKKGSKRRKKKKRTSSVTTEPSDADISSTSEAKTPDVSVDSAKIPEINNSLNSSSATEETVEKTPVSTSNLKLELSPTKEKKRKSDGHKDTAKKFKRFDSMDKIVSPVVPQPGAWLKRPLQFNRNSAGSSRSFQRNRPNKTTQAQKCPTFKEKNRQYQYGNYNRYYGYRNPNHEVDPRLRYFASHRQIFVGKDILDIGCNIGHITLTVARDFGARSVVGLDIDKKLIGIARKNVRHYVNCSESPRPESENGPRADEQSRSDKLFPISMPILYGPVDVPGMQKQHKVKRFPHNVTFVQGNYILDDDALLCTEQSQFDIILCLSVTKWFHLNWGDAGLKQAFRRMYAQLKPGGKLILEPQCWASYKHKKNLTETIYKNFHAIEFFPEKFTQYLLSSEVGFAKSEVMGQPHHSSKGFQRVIQIFTKSDLSPSQSQRSYSTPSHTITSAADNKKVYTCMTSPDHPGMFDEQSEFFNSTIDDRTEPNKETGEQVTSRNDATLDVKIDCIVRTANQNSDVNNLPKTADVHCTADVNTDLNGRILKRNNDGSDMGGVTKRRRAADSNPRSDVDSVVGDDDTVFTDVLNGVGADANLKVKINSSKSALETDGKNLFSESSTESQFEVSKLELDNT